MARYFFNILLFTSRTIFAQKHKKLPKLAQNFTKHKINHEEGLKFCQSGEMWQNLVTLPPTNTPTPPSAFATLSANFIEAKLSNLSAKYVCSISAKIWKRCLKIFSKAQMSRSSYLCRPDRFNT